VTKENLAMITEILISVFTPEYIPPAGPKAFVLFWATTYKPRKELAPFYSKELAACLEAFHAVRTEKANSGTSFMEKQSIVMYSTMGTISYLLYIVSLAPPAATHLWTITLEVTFPTPDSSVLPFWLGMEQNAPISAATNFPDKAI
jgi:hypothetical protein